MGDNFTCEYAMATFSNVGRSKCDRIQRKSTALGGHQRPPRRSRCADREMENQTGSNNIALGHPTYKKWNQAQNLCFSNVTSKRIMNLSSKDLELSDHSVFELSEFATLKSMTSDKGCSFQVPCKPYHFKSVGWAFQCLFCACDLKLLHQNRNWLPSVGYFLIAGQIWNPNLT